MRRAVTENMKLLLGVLDLANLSVIVNNLHKHSSFRHLMHKKRPPARVNFTGNALFALHSGVSGILSSNQADVNYIDGAPGRFFSCILRTFPRDY